MATVPFDALVLSGGRGRRLGGVAKAEVAVAGHTLLERAHAAVAEAGAVVDLGPEVPGGPVAAVAAGLRRVTADVVVVLACDMPLVTPRTVARLVDTVADDTACDGAVLVDADGRRQYVAAAYRGEALRVAVRSVEPVQDAAMRRLVRGLRLTDVRAHADEAMDCDTWSDVRRAVELLEGR